MLGYEPNFYHCRIARSDFIDIVFNKGNADFRRIEISDAPESKAGHLDLYWSADTFNARNERQEYLPLLITMGKNEIRDFLAWTSTYFPAFAPLTSYINISDRQTLPSSLFSISHYDIIDDDILNALIGMTVAEAYISGQTESAPFVPDILKCEMTFSYLLSRALMLGYDQKALTTLYEEWKASLSFAGIAFANLRLEDYLLVLSFLSSTCSDQNSPFGVYRKNNVPFSFYQDSKFEFECFQQHIDRLFKSPNELSRIGKIAKEERYSMINEFYHSAFDGIEGQKCRDMILAYLVNMISPGTAQHMNFFRGKKVQKSIWLWYGAFAGLTEKTKIRDVHDCVGRRLYRDMTTKTRHIETPACDISSLEARTAFESPDEIVRSFKKRIIKMQFALGIDIDLVFPVRQKIAESNGAKDSNEIDPQKIITNMIKELYSLNSLIGKKANIQSAKHSNSKDKSKKRKGLFDGQNINP